MAAGDRWTEGHDLSALRAFITSGEPWDPQSWTWLFEGVGERRRPILNYSGGTEIGGAILTCYTVLPLKPCAFSGPVVGMDADVVDDGGAPVRGTIGELVVRNTWPGMTHGFLGDTERYLETYWSRFPGVWLHGDLAVLDEDGWWSVAGRSDDTIKLAGKRVGPAEIESALIAHPAVDEAAAIGVPDDLKGQALVCFVVLDPEAERSARLEDEIRATVTDRLGRSLAPQRIIAVEGLPKTRNGKIVRRAIAGKHLGRPLGDLSSLESERSLDHIPTIEEARR
jgi:acetyl-CoA synthetase